MTALTLWARWQIAIDYTTPLGCSLVMKCLDLPPNECHGWEINCLPKSLKVGIGDRHDFSRDWWAISSHVLRLRGL
jgi:hypothetical protein